jgi:hypothetical protein
LVSRGTGFSFEIFLTPCGRRPRIVRAPLRLGIASTRHSQATGEILPSISALAPPLFTAAPIPANRL